MKNQKRYTSEAQIIKDIDRAHELDARDVLTIHDYRVNINRLLPFQDQIHAVNHHKHRIKMLEKRINGRAGRLAKMKAKLAEFRTLTFPGMESLMTPTTIVR